MNSDQDKNVCPWGEPQVIGVDRGAGDLRRGLPVIIHDGDGACVLLSCENITPNDLTTIKNKHNQLSQSTQIGVLITDKRSATLKVPSKGRGAVLLELDNGWSNAVIRAIGDPTLDLSFPLKGPFVSPNRADTNVEVAAIKLLKIASVLPAGLVLMGNKDTLTKAFEGQNLLELSVKSIEQYNSHKLVEMEEVVRANVPLASAENCTVVSFRPRSGGTENLAIVINNPDTSKPVLTRLHSECFTGDLLGSLKCDCGTQLQGAIAEIEKAGSGVLLYLAQEGRGLGLTSKLKAYTLQEQGFDTVDANLRLGFEVDERLYGPAAKMLEKLNISSINLMTNNPKKVEAMEKCGIKVAQRLGHHFPTNKHNEGYIETKKARTGHLDN